MSAWYILAVSVGVPGRPYITTRAWCGRHHFITQRATRISLHQHRFTPPTSPPIPARTLLPPALPVTPRPAFLLLSRLLLAILLTPHFILRSLHPSPLLYYIPCSSPARLTPRLIPASLPDHFHSNQTLALSLRFCHSLHPLVSPTCFTSSLHHVVFPFASFSYFTFSIHFLASPFASLSVLSPQPFPLASLPYLIHSPQHSALPPRSLPMSRRFTFLASHSCLYSALYSVSFNTRSLFLASVLCFISSLSQAAYFTYVHTLDFFHYFNTPSLFLCFVSLLQLLASPAPLHFLISSTSSLCLSSQVYHFASLPRFTSRLPYASLLFTSPHFILLPHFSALRLLFILTFNIFLSPLALCLRLSYLSYPPPPG